MLNAPPLPNILIHIWADLQDSKFIWQVAGVVISLLLAWLAGKLLRPRIESSANARNIGRDVMRAIQFPLLAVLLILGIRAAMGGKGLSLLDLMVALLTAAIILRLAVVMLRQVFAPSGWRDKVIRYFATLVWLGFALYIAGLLPDLIKFLDGLGFSIGKQRISLFLVLQGLLSVLVTLLIALWLGRMIEARAMAATDLEINLRVMISKLAKGLLVLAAILFTLPAVGIDITVLSVFGGALGVGLGFGLQKIASSYISGFIILMDRSVSIGDLITIDQKTGQLTQMNARYVVVRGLGGIESIIPNDTLITSTVVNLSYTNKHVRQAVAVQVSYDSDLELAMRLMVEIANRQKRVILEPAPKALITRFGDSGIDLELGFWVDDLQDGTAVMRSDMHLDIWREFGKHNIEIPFPQRTVRVVGLPGDTKVADIKPVTD